MGKQIRKRFVFANFLILIVSLCNMQFSIILYILTNFMQNQAACENKENIFKLNNVIRSKIMKQKRYRPETSNLETTLNFQTTFNPFSRKNTINIPIINPIKSKRFASFEDQNDSKQILSKPSSRQKPIIAKNNKLKDFFAFQPNRYHIKIKEPQVLSFRRNSISTGNTINIRRQSKQSKQRIIQSSRLNVNSVQNKQNLHFQSIKMQFELAFMKQKEAYQKILDKYGVSERIDDFQLNKYLMQ